jgi:SEC7 domain proteins
MLQESMDASILQESDAKVHEVTAGNGVDTVESGDNSVISTSEAHKPAETSLSPIETSLSPIVEPNTLAIDSSALTPPTTPPSATSEKFSTPEGVPNGNQPDTAEPSETTDNSEYRKIALKLFQEDFVSIEPEEYTQFLAASDEELHEIRTIYMNLFKWDASLLKSTRMLCSKLYLRGESQEIDRILSSFTKSYISQHQTNVFCTRNFEKIYIIIYSLILLNTALHNSEVTKKSKISQSDYIKNTFTTFIQQNSKSSSKLSIKQRIIIERELSNFYEDLSKNELNLKQCDPPQIPSPKSHKFRQSFHKKTLGDDSNDSSTTTTTQEINSKNAELPKLSRQITNSSIWSTDSEQKNSQKNSLQVKRMSSATSAVSQYTAINNPTIPRTNRVGFTRALLSDQNQKFYKNGNTSAVSNVSTLPTKTIRNRPSMEYLRNTNERAEMSDRYSDYKQTKASSQLNTILNKRASRSSIISKESHTSQYDETMSVLSFDTDLFNNVNFGEELQLGSEGQQLEDFNVDDFQDQYDLTLELQGSPYLKEGLLKLKILNNDQQDISSMDVSSGVSSSAASTSSSSQSTSSRFFSLFSRNSNQPAIPQRIQSVGTSTSLLSHKFIENFVVVSKGELSLYSFDPKVIKKHQQKLKKIKEKQFMSEFEHEDSVDDVVGDGNWLNNAAKIGSYNLCSTFARLEKQPANQKIMWSLTFPKVVKKNAKRFIFEAGTKEIALEFINTCNFWASKITAIPTLEESVSNIEYGWTNLDGIIAKKDQFKKDKHIMKWENLPKGIYLSSYVISDGELEGNHLGMMKQFVKTLKYYNHTKKLYNEFTKLKYKFEKNLPLKQYSCANYSKVVANYDAKISDYRTELTKYKNYLIILGFGLQLRFDLEDEEEENGDFEGSNDEKSIKELSENSPTSIETQDNQSEKTVEKDDELTKSVKTEIRRLFTNMKDVGKIIPTFQSSKSINDLTMLLRQQEKDAINLINPLVKSPKTFALSNYNDNESPINQLLQSSGALENEESNTENIHNFTTNTIKEEEEPEDQEVETPVDTKA